MSERWKPKKGEKYWVIDNYAKVWRHTYSNDTYDSAFYSVGNCFRTEAEARSAAKKFKDLMLSLHEPVSECSQVPKIEVDDRGVKMPEWCKVGEWCYCLDDDGNDKYFKITQIKDNFIYGEDWDIDYHFVKQARPRPYNAEEMRGLVGKVVDNDHGSTFLVTAFVPDNGGGVCIDGVVYNAEDLRACFGVGSKTCEKLEHLNEKGEWVE